MNIYVVVTVTATGKRIHAAFAHNSHAVDFATANLVGDSWFIEVIPFIE